ncbi:hypothetical protein [Neisseria sp.]|uniref:hypothetical protein n=1 Tax=Neisseria sp. TaxID=192066 RepID=UPI0035A1BE46
MNEQQIQQLISNIAILHNELQKQSMEALTLQKEGLDRLSVRLNEVNSLVEDAVANQLGSTADDIRQRIAEGGQKGLSDFSRQIEDLKRQMIDFSEFISLATKRLDVASRSVLIKIGYLAAFALVSVIGSALWLGWYYSGIINEKSASVENLTLFQNVDVVKCGEQLCAKIKKNTPAELRKNGYFLIEQK